MLECYNCHMSEDQFTKLFKYVQEFREEVSAKLELKASQASMDILIKTLDGFVKRIIDSEDEQTARDAQFERLLEWAREVSKKTGIPLRNL